MDNEKLKILIVDDEPDILEILKINLENEGYKVYSASNGKKALKKADLIIPDLIILDIMMPIMDGIETCERLRLDERFKETIVIFLTARGEEYSHIAAFESGADDYITKPVRIKILISKIKALFRRKLATDEESLPSPSLFNGCIFAILSAIFSFFNIKFEIFDLVKLGAMQLTLMFGANSAASETVKPSTAPLADETML